MIYAPISIGELFDKISILEIKKEEFTDAAKLAHVDRELAELEQIRQQHVPDISLVQQELAELKLQNKLIWINEDKAREWQKIYKWDYDFAQLANMTYKANTRRAELKKIINHKYHSEIVETKSYMSGD